MNEIFAPITDGKTLKYSQDDMDARLAAQRESCGDAVSDECDKINITYGTELITLDDAGLLIDACLEATGEKNER